MQKTRKTELYRVLIREKRNPENHYKNEIILKSFLSDFFSENVYSNDENNKFYIKKNDVCYYINEYKEEDNLATIKLNYIKYNKNLSIVNVNTLNKSKVKNKNEGDEEKQHLVIKYYESLNKAVIAWETIVGAVSRGVLEKEINTYFRKWTEQFEEAKELLLKGYEILIEIIPSPEFIQELLKLEKISLMKIIVDKERVTIDEDTLFSEDNISKDDVEMVYKPIKGNSFSKHKVKSFFEKYQNNKCNNKVKRIVIQGRKDKNNIRLDTEGMKLSKYIQTNIDSDGLIDTDSIYLKYKDLLNREFKDYFDDIVVDIEEEGE